MIKKVQFYNQQKVSFRNKDEEKLIGIKTFPIKQKAKNPSVILVHGFGVTKHESGMFDKIAYMLAENGFISFRFDFSGCGESEGDYRKTSLTKLKNDLKEVVKFVRKDPLVDSSKIGMLAQSFGTAVAIALGAQVKTLVFMGSFADAYSTLKSAMTKFNPKGLSYRLRSTGQKTYIDSQFWTDLKSYNLTKLIKNIKCPKLFIHGEKDLTVPIHNMKTLYESVQGPKQMLIIKGADHGLRPHRRVMYEHVIAWFNKHLT